MKLKIYASSKLKHAEKFKALNIPFRSSWLEGVPEGQSFGDMWLRYFDELADTDLVLMYLEAGDMPKGALIEVGAALSRCAKVMVVFDGNMDQLADLMGTIVYHPEVSIEPSFEQALATILRDF